MIRGSWEQSRLAGGRRTRGLGASVTGSPFDFSSDQDERVDPVEFLAIRADDELLDGLRTGRLVGPAYTGGFDRGLDDGYADDQRVLALLAELRAEIDSVSFPELVSVDEACAAIAAGQRAARPRRRLMSVAAAAVVVLMGLSGVAVAAGNAQPGDALWGVSTALNGNRARSVEAAYHVDTALAAAQRALAEGRVGEARTTLASVAPELGKVDDPDRRDELTRKARNLSDTVGAAQEGERVPTDEHGAPRDPDWTRHRDVSGATSGNPAGAANGSRPGTETPNSGQQPGRPNPSELFVPVHPGSPAAPAQPQPSAPANPGAGNPGTPAFPGFPGSGTPSFPGWPGTATPARPGTGTPGSPGPGTPGSPGPGTGTPGGPGPGPGTGTPGSPDAGGGKTGQPGTPSDPRTGRPSGGSDDPRRGPTKPTTATTTPPANSPGCPQGDGGSPNDCGSNGSSGH